MLRRLMSITALSLFLMAFSSAWGDFSLNGSSSLDSFNHDLENMHITLEKLSADWQLTPSANNTLAIHRLRAKRMLITIKENTTKTDSRLPEAIKLPLPIHVQQAEIAEVLVITKGEQYTLTNVLLSFDGNAKNLTLNLKTADTPWGKASAALNLATANPFAIAGKVNIIHADKNIPYTAEALISGDLNTLYIESESLLTLKNKQLAIIKPDAIARDSAAQILTRIELGLTDDYPIKLVTNINALHPERLGNYPTGKLNLDIHLQGKLLPKPDLQLSFASRDSQWQNQTLSSSGELFIKDTAIRDINIQATLQDNKLIAKGHLNQPDSALEWQLDLPNLAVLGKDYSGQAFANGSVEGVFDHLALRFNLKANKLNIANTLKLNQLEGQATLMASDNGKFEGELNASTLQYASNPIVDGSIQIAGTRGDHQIKLTAHNEELKFESKLQGGLISLGGWQGNVQRLSFQGEKSIKLQAPAPLKVSSGEVSLQHAKFTLTKGQAVIDNLQLNAGHFASKGQLKNLALADIPPALVTFPKQLQGNLTVSGIWDIHANESVNGALSFWRESGDLTFMSIDNQPLALGLSEAKINAMFDQNKATLDVEMEGRQLGSLNAQLTTTLSNTDKGYALRSDAPLQLRSTAQLRTLAWLPLPIALSDADIDGQLTFNIDADGTIQSPNLNGIVTGKNLQLSLLSEGVALTEGTLQANFDKDKLVIEQAKWKGGEGYITTSGAIGLDDNKPKITLDWKAKKFTVLSRTDRELTLSGDGETLLANDLLTITGNFTADKGLIQLAEEGTPKLGDDVIILGKAESMPEANLKILMNGLRIALGNDFTIRGQGIDAQLTGAVTLTGLSQYQPHAEGSIQIKKGTYLAYGQALIIEEGRFTFSGPLDNPGINLRAMRNSTPVNAGIEVTGSAYAPMTKLISEPSVPDSEKLSWLVLGHGMDQTGGNEFAMLSLAAGAILTQGQSVPLQTQLARAAGLDEFSVSGADAESTALTLGKRLSSKLYLSYQKSINGLLDVARLTFNMTPRWSLRAESGTESAVDVLYTFSFN